MAPEGARIEQKVLSFNPPWSPRPRLYQFEKNVGLIA